MGGCGKIQRPREVADARHDYSYSGAAGFDDVRQDRAIGLSRKESKVKRTGVKTGHYKTWTTMNFSQAALNATLNGTSGILLAAGYAAIRAGKREAHKRFMISAFVVSSIFLASYLVYHYRVGHVAFQGQGWIRPVYFVLLTSPTILAIVIVPLILITLRRAWLEKFDKHKIIAKWTLPLWFYVCVTGVIVDWMVYQMYGPGSNRL